MISFFFCKNEEKLSAGEETIKIMRLVMQVSM